MKNWPNKNMQALVPDNYPMLAPSVMRCTLWNHWNKISWCNEKNFLLVPSCFTSIQFARCEGCTILIRNCNLVGEVCASLQKFILRNESLKSVGGSLEITIQGGWMHFSTSALWRKILVNLLGFFLLPFIFSSFPGPQTSSRSTLENLIKYASSIFIHDLSYLRLFFRYNSSFQFFSFELLKWYIPNRISFFFSQKLFSTFSRYPNESGSPQKDLPFLFSPR